MMKASRSMLEHQNASSSVLNYLVLLLVYFTCTSLVIVQRAKWLHLFCYLANSEYFTTSCIFTYCTKQCRFVKLLGEVGAPTFHTNDGMNSNILFDHVIDVLSFPRLNEH